MKKLRRSVLIGSLFLCAGLLLRASGISVQSGSWTQTGNLLAARIGASSALLPDGRILVTGGDSGSGPVASADFFNADGTVSAAPPMMNARSQHVSVALQDGRVLVAGGLTAGGSATSTAEIFDPLANSWTNAGVGMIEARSSATVALLQDGRVVVAGGQNGTVISSTIEIFDPTVAAGAFNYAGTMSSPRTQHAMALLQDGRVLIVGGNNGTAPVASTDIFDPMAGTVTPGPSLAVARFEHSATTLLNGQVVVIGGNNGNTDPSQADVTPAELVDFTATTPAFVTLTPNLATPREGHFAILLPNNNSLLIAGGTSAGTVLGSAELFSAQISSTGAWSYSFASTGAMTAARGKFTGSANQANAPSSLMQRNGIVTVAGGSDANGNALNSTEAYGYPTVQTDAADYPPGTTVNMSGSGFQPGETIAIQLVESPLIDTHGPYMVTADSNGNFTDSSFTTDLHDENVLFFLSATGQSSGLQAQNKFTDSVTPNLTATCATNPVGVNNPTICTVTVAHSGSGGSTPTGKVSWKWNTSNTTDFTAAAGSTFTAPNQCTLSGSGNSASCSLTYTPTSTGAQTIAASYPGDANYNSTSGNTGLTVYGAAAKLVFTNQPIDTLVGSTIDSPTGVQVSVEDSSNNVVANSTAQVTVAIGTNPGSGTLSGTLQLNAVNGVATFSNLSINKAATGYTLTAASNNLTGATSNSFNVTAPNLTATKTDNLTNSTTTLGNGWTWSIQVANTGGAPATFTTGQTILTDHLPASNITYGAVSGAPGHVNCAITSNVLSCAVVGAGQSATIAAGGSFTISFTATPSVAGPYNNPTGGACQVDPNNVITNDQSLNTSCSDNVTVLGVAKVNFATSNPTGMNGANVNVTSVSYTDPNSNAVNGASSSLTAPGPSTNLSTKPSTTVAFTFPPTVTNSGVRYALTAISCNGGACASANISTGAGSFTDGVSGTTESVTGTYVAQYQVTFAQSGLNSDATGTVVNYNGTSSGSPVNGSLSASQLGTAAASIYFDASTAVTYTYSSPVNSTNAGERYVLDNSVNPNPNPASISSLSATTTVTGTYKTQYQVTFALSGVSSDVAGTTQVVGLTSPGAQSVLFSQFGSNSYSQYFDAGSAVTGTFANPLASTMPGKQYALTSGTIAIASLSGAQTITGTYKVQWQVTFAQSGIPSSDIAGTTTVVTVNSAPQAFSTLPFTAYYDSGSTVNYSYASPIASSNSGEQFALTNSPGTSVMVSAAATITGNYKTQYQVTFTQSGIGGDTGSNQVLSLQVNGGTATNYTASTLPPATYYDAGTAFAYTYSSPVATSPASGKQYVLTGTSPVSIPSLSAATTVTGTYKTQYQVTFTQSGIGSDTGSNQVLSLQVNGGTVTTYTASTLPPATFYDAGTALAYTYSSPVATSPASGKQYVLTGTSPVSISSLSAATTVTGSYKTQYQVTFTQSGIGSDTGSNQVLSLQVNGGTATTYTASTLPPATFYDAGTAFTYTYSSPVATSPASGKQYVLTGTSPVSIPTLSAATTVTGTYKTQYQITFAQSGIPSSDIAGTTTVVTVNSTPQAFSTLPFTAYYDSGSTVNYSYASPIASSNSGEQFVLINSPGSSVMVSAAATITGNYKVQYQVTFAANGFTGDASGNVLNYSGTQAGSPVGPTNVAAGQLSYSAYFDAGTQVSYGYNTWVTSTTTGKLYLLSSPAASPASPFSVTTSVTVTATYIVAPKITVTKTTNPASDTSTNFGVTVSGTGLIYEAASETLTGNGAAFTWHVAPGTYSVTEPTLPSGWVQTTNGCTSLTVTAGSTTPCGITNTKQPVITLIKTVLPSTDTTDGFNLLINSVVAKYNVTNGQSTGAIALTPGNGSGPWSYTVSEAVGTGAGATGTGLNNFVSSINCGSGPAAGTSLTLNLAAGSVTSCTITNVLATVTVATTNTATAKQQPQYSDPVTFTATVYTTSGSGLADGVNTGTFFVGTQSLSGATKMGHCSLADNGNGQMTCQITVPLVDATTTASGNFAPGGHTAYAQFADSSSNVWAVPSTAQITNNSNQPVAFSINQEDAAITYTGANYFSSTNTTMNIPVTYTLQDATAVTGNPIYDAYPGDITKATTSLVLTEVAPSAGKAFNCAAPPTSIAVSGEVGSNGLPSTATLSCTFDNVPVGATFTLAAVAGNGSYYGFSTGDTSEAITTATGGTGFITGGGFQTEAYLDTPGPSGSSKYTTAGLLKPAPGTKMNFGFETQYKKNSQLQGGVNIIIRSQCLSGITGYTGRPGNDGLCVYQMKVSQGQLQSLTENLTPAPPYALLVGNANIQDVTWPTAVGVAGNLTLQLWMWDVGDPGPGANVDPLAIQVTDNTYGLWLSNNWSGAKTVITTSAPVIQGGNLQVH